MKKRLTLISKYILAILIGCTCLTSLAGNANVMASEEIGIEENTTYNEAKTSASIALDTASIGDSYKIADIIQPDGSKMDLNNPVLSVTRNGTYTFKVSYTNNTDTDEEPAQQNFDKEVVVDGIVQSKEVATSDSDETTKSNTSVSQAQGIVKSTVTGGGATIDIPGYTDAVGLNNANIITVNVTADFSGDNTTDGKTLEVTLPEGLRFIQIPVAGTYSTTGVDTTLLAPYPSSDPLATAIKTVVIPKQDALLYTSGKVTYTFDKGTKLATLAFQIRVDNKRYYQPMQIPNPIAATVSMGGSEVGNTTQSMKVNGVVNGTGLLDVYTNLSTSKQLLASTESSISYGFGQEMRLKIYDGNNSNVLDSTWTYMKSATYYIYYPQGTKYESLIGAPAGTIVDDPTNSRIILTLPTWNSSFVYSVKYSVPIGTPDGTYTNKAKDYVVGTWYDGTVQTQTSTGGIYSVNVISNMINKVDLSLTGGAAFYDDSLGADHYKYGPFFYVKNTLTAGVKTNQVAHFEFGANWHVRAVNLPFDSSIVGNTITNIQYKTNKNANWRTFAISSPTDLPTTGVLKVLSATKVGLESDEWFTEISANVGSFSLGYASMPSGSPAASNNVTSYGQLVNGVASETTKFSMYDASNKDATLVSQIGSVVNSGGAAKTTAANASATFNNAAGTTSITQILAGSSFMVKSTLNLHGYPYGNTTALRAPQIYLRQPVGMTLDIGSLVLKDISGSVLTDWTYTTHVNAQGETIYTIQTSNNTIIGSCFGDGVSSKNISIQYTMSTSLKATGNVNAQELISFGSTNSKPWTYVNGSSIAGVNAQIDIYDFNGNGNTTEMILTTGSRSLSIVANKNVLVETFLSLAGQAPSAPYVDGVASTVSYFTPGTDADYTLQITNNGDGSASSFDTYIPIPKTGKSFGSAFQSAPFHWDARISSAIALDDATAANYQVLYSTDATASNYNTSAEYDTTPPSDLSKVTMVKINAINPIPAGATATIKVPLKVDETFASATAGNKIGTKNIFNPVYDVTSATFSGTMPGTKVGSELVIAQMSGIAFQDMDGDGLFDATKTDTLLSGIKVDLYKWDSVGSTYKAVLGSDGVTPVSTTTDSSGHYLFDYTVGMNYGNYAVHFNEKTGGVYQYTINVANKTNNSSAIISGAQKGWAINVDPTKPAAQNVNVGYLAYNPPVDLSATINTPNGASVKVGNTLTLTSSVLPTALWPTIQDTTTPYTWSFVNAADSSKATLTTGTNGTLIVTPSALANGTTTIAVKLNVKDIYGNTAPSAPVTITVVSNVAPVVTAPTLSVYVGDSVNLLSGVSAKDNTNATITLVTAPGVAGNTTIDDATLPVAANKYTTAGTYQVNISVSDVYGNTKVQPRLIQVNDKPSVVATTQVYNVGDTNILNGVTTNATASWMKAPAAVGSAVATPIAGPAQPTPANNKISYSVAGPSTDFSKVGIYSVTYTATDPNGHTGTSTVSVAVVPVSLSKENSASVDASNFTIAYASVAGITLDSVKASANALGFTYTYENGVLTAINQVTMSDISIDTTQFNNIKAVSKAGGTFPLTYSVISGSDTATKTINVTVSMATDPLSVSATAIAMKVGATQSIAPIVNLDYWSAIQDATTPYAWSYADPSDSQYVTLSNTNTASVGVEAIKKKATPVVLNLTIKDKTGRTATTSVNVTVHTNVGPTITLPTIHAYVGDTMDLMNGISAVDDNAATLTLNSSNTVITQSIPVLAGLYKTAGTYQVAYTVEDSYGNKTTSNRLVKVNGMPTITATSQTYKVTNATIAASVSANASATFNKAQDVIGGATATALTPTYSIKSGPSIDFSKVGIYKVEYEATTPENKVVKAVVDVQIVEDDAISVGEVTIHAVGYTIENSESSTLTQALALSKANATASKDDGTNITDISSSITVDATQLAAIQAASKVGGIFPLTYNVTSGSDTGSKTIMVSVKGSNVVINNGITLYANNFAIENDEASTLGEAKAKALANASAILTTSGVIVTNIVVDEAQLSAIQATGKTGGLFDLTFTASETIDGTLQSVSKTIKVTVKGSGVVIENGLTIRASDFTLEHADASTLDETQAKTLANVQAIVSVSGEEVTNISVNAAQLSVIQATPKTGGIYDLSFTATHDVDGVSQSATKTIKVTVKGTGVVMENGLILVANPFAIEQAQASGLTQAQALSNAQASAILSVTGEEVTDISVDATQLSAIQTSTSVGGVYDLTITAKATIDGTLQSVSKTIKVTLKGSSVVIENGLTIRASDFTLEHADASTLDETQAKTLANVQAMVTNTGASISNISVNAAQLSVIQATPLTGGIYDLSFTATHDVDGVSQSATKTIKVFVKGSAIAIENNMVLNAKDFTIENADAKNMTLDLLKDASHANVHAFDQETSQPITNIMVNLSDLVTLQAAPSQGGIYSVRITATSDDATRSVTKTIKVTVKGTGVVMENGLTLVANPFVIEQAQASGLTSAQALSKAQASAILSVTGEEVTDISVDATQLSAIQASTSVGGVYDLTITAKATIDGTLQSVSKTIKVTLKGSSVVIENGLTIRASDFTLEHADASTLDETQAKTLANVQAIVSFSGEEVTNISMNAAQLSAIQSAPLTGGIYDLSFTATHDVDGVNQSATKTIKVSVKGSGLVVENEISLYAVDFAIENADAKNITEAMVKDVDHAKVKAVETISGAAVDTTVDATQLAAIQAAPKTGGIYDLTITAKATIDGTLQSVSKTIKVSVKGTSVGVENGITIKANNVTIDSADASTLNETQAKTLANVQAMVTNTGASISNISVNAAQLSVIQATPLTGGIYDLSFTATHDVDGVSQSATKTIKVFVKGSAIAIENNMVLNAKDFTIENADAKNMTLDLLKDASHANVHAFDQETSQPITNIMVNLSDLVTLQAAPSQGGIYSVRITATSDDATRSVTKTIKVTVKGTGVVMENGLTLVANPFAIEQAQASGLTSAQALSKAQASAILSVTGEEVTDISVDATQLSAIQASTSVGGVYNLTITAKATIDGTLQSVSKTIKVTLKGSGVVIENGLTIFASDVVLDNNEAKDFDEASVRSKANVIAVINLSAEPVTDISVDATQLSAIQASTSVGGVYNLTITAKATIDGTLQSVSKTIKVTVKGSGVVIENGLTIRASDFTLEHADASTLDETQAKTLANVQAIVSVSGEEVTNISVNAAQLSVIQATPKTGGIYDLSFTATHDVDGVSQSATKTIKVTVKGTGVVMENGLTLVANPFAIEQAQASGLTQAQALSNAQASAILSVTGEEVTDISVDATQLSAIQASTSVGGVYDLTITAKATIDGTLQSVSKTIKVSVKGSGVVVEQGITLLAQPFTLNYADAASFASSNALSKANVQAFNQDGVNITNKITVDNEQIKGIQEASILGGIFPLTYCVEDGTSSASITLQIVVFAQSVETDPTLTLSLSASGFTLENSAASSLNKANVLALSNTIAYYFHKDANGTILSVEDVTSETTLNQEQLSAIQSAPTSGGLYDLTFTIAKESIVATKTIKVFVKSSQGVSDTNENISLGASSFVVSSNAVAALLTKQAILDQAKASAMKTLKSSDGIVLSYEDVSSSIVLSTPQVNALKTAPKTGGIYPITLTVTTTVDGNEVVVEKAIQAVVLPQGYVGSDDKTLGLSGNGFIVGYQNLNALTANEALKKASAQAFAFTLDANGDLVKVEDVTSSISVDEAQLASIKASTKEGATLPLTLSVTKDGVVVQKIIEVVVLPMGGDVSGDNLLSLATQGFSVTNKDAINLNQAAAIVKASAKAQRIEYDSEGNLTGTMDLLANIKVDALQLKAINEATIKGGIFDLTYTITDQGETLRQTIQVFVKSANEVSDTSQNITLGASGFVLASNNVAKALTQAIALQNAQALAIKTLKDGQGNLLGYQDVSSNIKVNEAQLNAIQSATSLGGIYKLDIRVEDGDITLTKTIVVVVVGSDTPNPTNGIAMSAHDATISYAKAIQATDADIVSTTHAIAYTVESGKQLQVQVDATSLNVVQKVKQEGGVFDITLQANSNNVLSRSTNTSSIKIKITVERDPNVVDPTTPLIPVKQVKNKTGIINNGYVGVKTRDTTNITAMLFLLLVSSGYIVLRKKEYQLK